MYNVFRLTGDGLHCLALMVLFGKMNQTRSCAGMTNTSSLLASSAACWLWFGGLLALPRAERLAVRRDLAEDGVPVRDRLLVPLCVPARRPPPARPLAAAAAPAPLRRVIGLQARGRRERSLPGATRRRPRPHHDVVHRAAGGHEPVGVHIGASAARRAR